MEVILKFDISQVMIIYNEMIAKTTRKGQKGVRIFIELLSSRESLREIVAEFWNLVIKFINEEVEALRDKLESNGAVVEVKPEGGYKFTALLGEDDVDSEIAELLLKSEEGSKEYLLSNVSLIYRGSDYIFNIENKDALTVAELGDTKIHCIRIIDTQGLFHSTGVKAKDESERIVDLLSEFHSTKLLLVVNSFVRNLSISMSDLLICFNTHRIIILSRILSILRSILRNALLLQPRSVFVILWIQSV